MGVGLFRGSKCAGSDAAPPAGNPDPRRFEILRIRHVFGWTVAEVQYPDAKNYEGRKIMVYRCKASVVRAQAVLDPHFCDDKSHLSPFARFEPTEAGWDAALMFVGMLSSTGR